MVFFQNVAQLLNTIASPKQPQSLTGFVKARTRVSGVNIPMKIRAPFIAHRVHALNSNAVPTKNSARDNTKERKREHVLAHPIPKALK